MRNLIQMITGINMQKIEPKTDLYKIKMKMVNPNVVVADIDSLKSHILSSK